MRSSEKKFSERKDIRGNEGLRRNTVSGGKEIRSPEEEVFEELEEMRFLEKKISEGNEGLRRERDKVSGEFRREVANDTDSCSSGGCGGGSGDVAGAAYLVWQDLTVVIPTHQGRTAEDDTPWADWAC
ncbi:hypothetical protein Nepgr_013309 [Nepenthes gracilis]|uniref:Uncharacterized protein n=1 Tax=Nepenthes gracilis TaxID=150966 RepID=A0AAD3SHJ8_NEPGR|nr:hypothetical protein Nepgr_013309 [Nepenthes gracilis]